MAHMKEFKHLKIQLETIKTATNNFSDESCIGRGGFGKVYKGKIAGFDGHTTVALKRLDRRLGQGDPEFWKEIMMLSLYKHVNIVSLLGFCDDCSEKILVYEYVPKKSLDYYLNSDELSWIQRLKICIGAAHGLAFLHNAVGNQQRVLHRDIKSSNILLDEGWNAKISDFGLAKFGPTNEKYSFLYSHPAGTPGYFDPLYAETGFLTKESDVYSFGVVLFEVLCGRLCIDNKNIKHPSLIGLARQAYEKNTMNEIVYVNIKDEINPDSLQVFAKIAFQCLKRDRDERPLMSDIVGSLETALRYQEPRNDQVAKTYFSPKPPGVLNSNCGICDFCNEATSMVYCISDAARLCLACDWNIHSVNVLARRHSRTLICHNCNSEPAVVRCVEEKLSFCANCDWLTHGVSTLSYSSHSRQTLDCFSGCPPAAELSSFWSVI